MRSEFLRWQSRETEKHLQYLTVCLWPNFSARPVANGFSCWCSSASAEG